MFRKIYLVLIISLITIFSFSIVNVYCPFKTFGIFDVWLIQLNGFKEYYFFSYGFLKNLLLLFVIYLTNLHNWLKFLRNSKNIDQQNRKLAKYIFF